MHYYQKPRKGEVLVKFSKRFDFHLILTKLCKKVKFDNTTKAQRHLNYGSQRHLEPFRKIKIKS